VLPFGWKIGRGWRTRSFAPWCQLCLSLVKSTHFEDGCLFLDADTNSYDPDFEEWQLGKLSALREIALAFEGQYKWYYMGQHDISS
jgi:hypothetical protein